MAESRRVCALLLGATILFLLAIPVKAQSLLPLRIDSVPTGLRPLGIAIYPHGDTATVVVANSGDNSITIFAWKFNGPAELVTTLRGIPAPNGISFCSGDRLLVTSPSDNSVTVIKGGSFYFPESWAVLGTIKVGPQPNAAACVPPNVATSGIGVVSNQGDNTLSVLDLGSFSVTATVPDVPAALSLHGVELLFGGSPAVVAWVAGTDANVVTLVDLITARILTRIPVPRPTAIRNTSIDLGTSIVRGTIVASALGNKLITFNSSTLEIASTISNVPNPQDFAFNSRLGLFTIVGGTNTLARITGPSNDVSIVPGIAGSASLASFGYSVCYTYGCNSYDAVLVTSSDSNRLFSLAVAPDAPRQFTVQNAGSFSTSGASSGALASTIMTTGVSQNFFATSLPLPKTLGGITLRIGGNLTFETNQWVYSPIGSIEAPLLFVGPTQINFQIPTGIAPGDSVPAQIQKPDGTTLLTTLSIVSTAPGIFTVLMNGLGQAAALNQDNSLNGNPQSILGARPAVRGSVIQLFATGGGETDPPLLPGEAAPITGNPLVYTRVQPTVTLGGFALRVQFSGMAPGFVGLWQINVEIPQLIAPGSAVPLTITAGGITSNTVTIAVE
ncbi:MAG: hypothetical protein A3F68_03240 [Acidobacteria bacterium RIFCSPLOWO2_12_FULL_54_10]|nr:MAG: hypothetical protein A3F68_03240 [Acidobacteria bacterium RIFCSPLOWO2_12_FULL_54_10]